MKIARTSSTLGIVQSRSRSRRDFEIFLHLPQYKLINAVGALKLQNINHYLNTEEQTTSNTKHIMSMIWVLRIMIPAHRR